MARAIDYPEVVTIRLPAGTKAALKALAGDGRVSDEARKAVLERAIARDAVPAKAGDVLPSGRVG